MRVGPAGAFAPSPVQAFSGAGAWLRAGRNLSGPLHKYNCHDTGSERGYAASNKVFKKKLRNYLISSDLIDNVPVLWKISSDCRGWFPLIAGEGFL